MVTVVGNAIAIAVVARFCRIGIVLVETTVIVVVSVTGVAVSIAIFICLVSICNCWTVVNVATNTVAIGIVVGIQWACIAVVMQAIIV